MSTAAVFLSYASQDADAAKRICEALRATGVEVWFDQNELVGGDAWDAKIRGQISSCALFVPVISAATQARGEGYFRLEWKLAVDRSHLMAHDQPFLLPVVIDATKDGEARVPPEFRAVQWTHLRQGFGGQAHLSDGEALEKFCARVKELLGGEAAVAGSEVGARLVRAQEEGRGRATPLQKPSRPWLMPAILAVAAFAALALWQPWRAKEKSATPVSPAAAVSPTAPLTEAQQLVAKARKILDDGDEMNRETYTLAEELLKKAETLDVTEASAWAVHAQLSSDMLIFGLDYSPARVEAFQAQASRAAKLAPDSLEAALALAQAQSRAGQDFEGVLQRMQALAEKYPNDWRVWRTLGRAALNASNTDRGLAAVNRALQLLPGDPRLMSDRVNLLQRAGRYPEAESAMVQALEGRTSARLGAFDVFLKLTWRGDLVGATAAVQRWPAWFLSEDRGCSLAGLAYLWAREPKKALEIVNRFPRDYIRNSFFYGPKAALTAWAHEAAGEAESAKAQWQIVIQLADRELSGAPEDGAALHWKAWALARLGRTDEAYRILRLLRERNTSITIGVGGFEAMHGNLAALAIAVGRPDEAIEQIANALTGKATYLGWAGRVTKSTLRLNPVFDPLRGDSRFQALIDAAPGPEEKKENASAGAAALDPKSVAVLAFANMSADKDNEYFSDGLSGNILDKLGRVPGLRVIGQMSSFSYKGKNVPAQQIGQELRVGTIVDGSVQKMGTRLRITARVINATDGTQVWSEPFDKDLTAADIFAMQDEIALKIAAKLAPGAAATPAAGSAQPTQNLAAYEAYLRGRSIEAPGFPQQRLQAMPYYEEAVRLDPSFALAWARIAFTQGALYVGGTPSGDEDSRAQQALDTAMRLQPDLPEVHLARSVILRANGANLREAAREIALAESRQPENADILYERALVTRFSGHLEEALALSQRAAERDPLNANILNNMGIILRFLGRYEEALAMLDRSLKVSASSFPHYNRAVTLVRAGGDLRQAVREFDVNTRDQFDAVVRAMKASILEAAGLNAEALAEINAIERPTFMTQFGYGIRSLHAARAQEMMDDAGGARRSYEESLPLALAYQKQQPQLGRAWSVLALVYAGLAKKDEAIDAIQTCLKLVPPAESPYYAAEILLPTWVEVQARFGMMDGALAVVREQIAAGWWRRNDLLLKPEFFVIRKDPRFRAIAEKAPL